MKYVLWIWILASPDGGAAHWQSYAFFHTYQDCLKSKFFDNRVWVCLKEDQPSGTAIIREHE
jgi:hypothetical protein